MKLTNLMIVLLVTILTHVAARQALGQAGGGGGYGGGGGGFNGGGGGQGGGFGGGGQGGGGRRANGGGFGGGGQGGGYGGGGQGGGGQGGFNGGGGGQGGGGFAGGQGGGGRRGGGGGQGGFNGGGGGGRGGGRRQQFTANPNAGNFGNSGEEDDQSVPAPEPMAGDYLTMTTRSIFYRGQFIPEGTIIGPTFTPREAILVFIGTFDSDDKGSNMLGFLENTDTNQVQTEHIGDAIAQGKITNITLDYMEYTTAAGIMRLRVGENLAGTQINGSNPDLPASEPGADLSGPQADILRKLMARRAKELGTPTPAK